MPTRGIAKTGGCRRDIVEISDFVKLKECRAGVPSKQVHLKQSKPTRKSPRKVDVLSLAFTMHPNFKNGTPSDFDKGLFTERSSN